MKKILDDKGNLLAFVIFNNENFKKDKFFATEENMDMQVASFNLKKGEIIDNHIHLNQERKVYTTTELIVLIEGGVDFNIFDKDLKQIEKVRLHEFDLICLIEGGHGMEVIEDSKFIEAKQGPFDPMKDKKRF